MKKVIKSFKQCRIQKKLFVFLSLSSLLIGCSTTRQPDKPSNPYAHIKKEPVEKTQSFKITDQPFRPELTPISPQDDSDQIDPTPTFEPIEEIVEPHAEIQLDDEIDIPAIRTTLSPAVLSLVKHADKSAQSGDLSAAAATLERALRIDGRNPLLTYKLAKLRLQQSQFGQAEALAKKAAHLSASDRGLKKHAWLLISHARKQQDNHYGAKEALVKARKI
jgi:hypothetical protein